MGMFLEKFEKIKEFKVYKPHNNISKIIGKLNREVHSTLLKLRRETLAHPNN